MTFSKLTVIRSYEFGIMALGILTLRTTIKDAKLSITALLTHILSVILLSVANEPIMLNVVMLSFVALSDNQHLLAEPRRERKALSLSRKY